LEKHKSHFPQVLRYPFFLIGLLFLIGGGVGIVKANLPSAMTVDAEAAVAIVGFVFLILAVAIP
jgi:hypothetical protein